MGSLLFKPGHFTRLGKRFRYHWLGGYAGPDSVWAAWKGESILPLSENETRYLDSPAAHDLSLQFLLTGGYNHVPIEVVSVI